MNKAVNCICTDSEEKCESNFFNTNIELQEYAYKNVYSTFSFYSVPPNIFPTAFACTEPCRKKIELICNCIGDN